MADDDAGPAKAVPTGRRRWPPRLRSLAISSKLAATIVTLSVASLLTATIVGLGTGWELRRELDDEELVALQAAGATDVASYFRHLERTAATTAASPQTLLDLQAFSAGHAALLATPPAELTDQRQAIIAEYQSRYIEPIEELGYDIELQDVAPDNPAATYLQFNYAIDDSITVEPDAIRDAGDGSEWTQHHAEAHADYRAIADGLDLQDLYLIDAETGNVVYSVRKRADLGTSLADGPFTGTGLSALVDEVRRNPEGGAVTGDLSYYVPALPDAVSVIAAPINAGDELVGVLAITVTSDSITDVVLSAAGRNNRDGDIDDFDLFLFGDDGTLRTDPDTYLAAPSVYLADSVENGGLTRQASDLIETFRSPVLFQTVAPPTLAAAIADDRTVEEQISVTGVEAFTVVSPVDVGGVDWYLGATLPVEAVETDLLDYAETLIASVAALVILVAFGAVAWSGRLMQPIRRLSDQLNIDLDRPVNVPVPARSPTEFKQLIASFTSMTDRVLSQSREVERTRQHRLTLLRTLLPPAVAERIAEGQAPAVDEIPRASVAVVVVLGLGGASSSAIDATDAGGVDRASLERVLADLDEAAKRHQLDRIKVVGDAYFAACGHDRPFIDHAPRAVSFATEARDLIGADLAGTAMDLGVTVGVDSGPVLAGMTAESGGVYDVWGETVTSAYYLARLGSRDEILISDRTSVLLPESITVEDAPDHGESVKSVEPILMGGAR